MINFARFITIRPFESVTDVCAGGDLLRRRRYGIIEMKDQRLVAVHVRPWPKHASLLEARCFGEWLHRARSGNRFWLYYNQPWTCRDYLAVSYILSTRETTIVTVRGGLQVLDGIARLKGTHAAVCHVTNPRISDRLLERWGWQRHLLGSRRRHFIRRYH